MDDLPIGRSRAFADARCWQHRTVLGTFRHAVSEAARLGNSLVLRADGESERPVWHIDYRHLYTNFYTVET